MSLFNIFGTSDPDDALQSVVATLRSLIPTVDQKIGPNHDLND
jgi:hypothetical protein